MAKGIILLVVLVVFLGAVSGDAIREQRARRINLPFLGIGYKCGECPQHFCDDDEAVVYGYCCGCSRFYDVLPIKCASKIDCPPNSYDLCKDYEYMMHCCC